MAKIHEAIGKVMRNVGAISKDKTNVTQNFMFRGIDQFMNHLNPLLADAGIVVATDAHYDAMIRETKVTKKGVEMTSTLLPITFHFISTEDGSEINVTTVGEGMDSGDKGVNKAESIALKYALMQLFLIPTEDIEDPDRESYEVAARQNTETMITLSDGRQIPKSVYDAMALNFEGEKLGKIYANDHGMFLAIHRNADPNSDVFKACEIIMKYKGEKA